MPYRMLLVESAYRYPAIERHHPPLGFGYVASSLRKEFGGKFQFRVINDYLADEIKSFQPDIVGITSVSKNYSVAKEHARVAKQANLPVVIGGVHISFLPQTMKPKIESIFVTIAIFSKFSFFYKRDKNLLHSRSTEYYNLKSVRINVFLLWKL